MIFFIAPVIISAIVAALATLIKRVFNPYSYFSKTTYAVKFFIISAIFLEFISVGGGLLYVQLTYDTNYDALRGNVVYQDGNFTGLTEGTH